MAPLYRWYYAGQVLIAIALLANLVYASAYLSTANQFPVTTILAFSLLFYQIPLALAVTIGLIITWKYWGWLFTEREN